MNRVQNHSFLVLFLVTIFFGVSLSPLTAWFQANGKTDQYGLIYKRILNNESDLPDTLVTVGDVLLARDIEQLMKHNGVDYPFLGVKDLLSSKYVFGNFEAAVPKQHQSTKNLEMVFSVDEKNLESIVNARFTHFSLANNHSLDFGKAGLENTIYQLELRGMEVFGVPQSVATSSIEYLMLSEVPIAVVALYDISGKLKFEDYKNALEIAKAGSQIQIVYIHWGTEYAERHGKTQEKLAHELIDNGVDVIVGHHPHVVQDIESYKNGLIFYSLGNFVFDQYFGDKVQQGLALRFSVVGKVLTADLVPLNNRLVRGQPHLMEREEKNEFLQKLAARSSPSLELSIQKGNLQFHNN